MGEVKTAKKTLQLAPLLILIFIGILAFAPFLSPILKKIGLDLPANIIYTIYSFSCHQKASRSAFLFDNQVAWCIRDTFIWISMFSTMLVIFIKDWKFGITFKQAFIIALPMALDGSIQLIGTIYSLYTGNDPFYESTNTIRALTGTFFGLAVGMYLFPKVMQEVNNYKTIDSSK